MQKRIMFLKPFVWACIAGLCLMFLPPLLTAQTSAGLPKPTRRAITDVMAYDGLIHLAVAMDKKAQELDSKNIKHGVRAAMTQKFGLDGAELAAFLDDCHKAHKALKDLDDQANPIITNFHKTISNMPASQQPPPPQELVTLKKQKDAAIRQAMADFRANLHKQAI